MVYPHVLTVHLTVVYILCRAVRAAREVMEARVEKAARVEMARTQPVRPLAQVECMVEMVVMVPAEATAATRVTLPTSRST
jgi:hypothetical protein